MNKERLLVSITTYRKRFDNIPTVLDTMFNQTVAPDLVVLNVAFDEVIPDEIRRYIESRPIEINRVKDTKVYKKLIPTLKKYPNDVIISIDDDWLYPNDMIQDFMNIHKQYPNNPISGNRVVFYGLQCHCGCASLVKSSYFGNYLEMVDDDVIINCPSDDIVYTYFVNKSGHAYLRTENEYFMNMPAYNAINGYTEATGNNNGIEQSYNYLVKRFGSIKNLAYPYLQDKYIADIVSDIYRKSIKAEVRSNIEKEIKNSVTYRIGDILLKPIKTIRSWIRLIS